MVFFKRQKWKFLLPKNLTAYGESSIGQNESNVEYFMIKMFSLRYKVSGFDWKFFIFPDRLALRYFLKSPLDTIKHNFIVWGNKFNPTT